MSGGCGWSSKSKILGAGATQRSCRASPDGSLLTGSGRPQIWLSRFPRFEGTARVVTKAEPGGTNEVMFWSPVARIGTGRHDDDRNQDNWVDKQPRIGNCESLPREIEGEGRGGSVKQ